MDSCFSQVRPRQHGIMSRRAEEGLKALCSLPFTNKAGAKRPFKRLLHTTHVGAGCWEPHGSSPTVCAGKVEGAKHEEIKNSANVHSVRRNYFVNGELKRTVFQTLNRSRNQSACYLYSEPFQCHVIFCQ